jgi:PEP-CTERM motif
MKNTRLVLLVAFVLLAFSMTASAAPACVNQTVTVGLVCSIVGPISNLTFAFEEVNFAGANTNLDSLSFETPSTGVVGSSTTLDFQLLATYPVDIHLVYKVSSTSANIIGLDSSFTPASGPPPPQINESACGSDPLLNPPCTPVLANQTNTTGNLTFTSVFGPVSVVWVDKDITNPGFSSFTDSVEIPGTTKSGSPVPEPASLGLLGCSLLGFALLAHRARAKK